MYLMTCSTNTSFFGHMGPNDAVLGKLVEKPFSLSFKRTGPYTLLRVALIFFGFDQATARDVHVIIQSGSLDIIGGLHDVESLRQYY